MERKREISPSAEENRKKQAKGPQEERESEESSDDEMKGDSGEKGVEASVDEAQNREDGEMDDTKVSVKRRREKNECTPEKSQSTVIPSTPSKVPQQARDSTPKLNLLPKFSEIENEENRETIPSEEEYGYKQGAEEQRESEEVSAEETEGDSGEEGQEESVDDADPYIHDPGNLSTEGIHILDPFVFNRLHDHPNPDLGNRRWVHARNTTKSVCLVTLQHTKRPHIIIRENEGGGNKHFEEVLYQYFDGNRRNIESIKIYCSASPCCDCSRYIRLMKNGLENPQNFKLIFSALYNIVRPSCTNRGCNCLDYSPRDSEANMQGLRVLKNDGVQMQTFTEKYWNELIALLGHHDIAQGRQETETALKDFYQNFKTLRRTEDEKMGSDLESILQTSVNE